MDKLISCLNDEKQEDISIDYNVMLLELQKSKRSQRVKYINYIIHGLNRDILNIDKLFFKSVVTCPTLDECFAVGLFIRLGADLERFYNKKNIMVHIVEKYYNYDQEIFIFLVTMMLLSGITYNDFVYKESSERLSGYFMSNSIEIFFPRNVRLQNQKMMNLFMDKKLTETDYHYEPYNLLENFDMCLIKEMVVEKKMKYGEDTLVQCIINSCNLNLLIAAVEATYAISYFSLERLCVLIKNLYTSNNIVLLDQTVKMIKYLEKNKIYVDNYQYEYIKFLIKDTNFTTNTINDYVRQIMTDNGKDYKDTEHILKKLDFHSSYVKELKGDDLKNLMYKVIYYKIKELGKEKVLKLI